MMRPTAQARFEAKVNKTAGCWLWTGRVNADGYGSLSVDTKTTLAHRYAYNLYVGPLEQGKEICHTCDVRNCVNPAHLFQGSHLENVRDMIAKGRMRQQQQTHCKSGHEFTEANTYARANGQRACRECKRIINQGLRRKNATPEYKAQRAAKESARRARSKQSKS